MSYLLSDHELDYWIVALRGFGEVCSELRVPDLIYRFNHD